MRLRDSIVRTVAISVVYSIIEAYFTLLSLGGNVISPYHLLVLLVGVGEMTLRKVAKDILNNMENVEFICSKCNNVVERITTYKEFIPTVNLLYNHRPLCKHCNSYFSMTDINIEIKDKKIKVKLPTLSWNIDSTRGIHTPIELQQG